MNVRQTKMLIAIIIGLLILIIGLAIIISIATRKDPGSQYPMVAFMSEDGSWWEVRQGPRILATMGRRSSSPVYQAQCPNGGRILAIGAGGGPIYCDTGTVDLVPNAQPSMLYGISGGCPSGWKMDQLENDDYVCVPDIECVAHSNCDPGHVCMGGRCVPIPDF